MREVRRELITVASEGELVVALPRLKNGAIANQDFIPLGVCALTPSLDFFSGAAAVKAECREMCGECPVRYECLEFSLVTEQEFGIWGGFDEKERKPMIKIRRLELANA